MFYAENVAVTSENQRDIHEPWMNKKPREISREDGGDRQS